MLAIGSRLSHFEVLELLGAGGMGEVYRARDQRLRRNVALKVLPDEVAHDRERVARFAREAHLLATLSHPNIVAIHEVGTCDGIPYLVEELLEGESLQRLLLRGSMPVSQCVEVAIQIARGLAAAHGKGIVHRDLKPGNVFVSTGGVVKILDFGLARTHRTASTTDTTETDSALSEVHRVVGTIGYMAPEQLRGLTVDHRTDLFALGCVLYEMLSGEKAFQGGTTADRISATLHADPPPLAAAGSPPIPPVLDAIVRRCLAKRPEDRFDSAHDVALSLETVLRDPTSPATPAGAKRRRSGVVLAFGATALAATLLLGVAGWLRHDGGSGFADCVPRQVTSTPGWEAEPALSPDGTLVVFTSYSEGTSDIRVVDASVGEPIRITSGFDVSLRPTWFPDGRWIAFTAELKGGRSIWRVPRLGGSASLLVPGGDYPTISPDGRRIAYSGLGPGGRYRIHVAPVGPGGTPTMLTGDADGLWDHVEPCWSPDGRLICYADQRDLWLARVDGGGAKPLTTSHANNAHPAWSPDGRWVYYSSHIGGTDAIWRIPAAGGEPERVTMGTGPELHPDVSRDGQRLIYSTFSDLPDVIVADRLGSERWSIGSTVLDSMPAVDAAGSVVVFVSNRGGRYDLWRQPIEEGRPHGPAVRLTDQTGSVATPTISPDGLWVAYFGVEGANRDIWIVPTSGGSPSRITDDPVVDIHPTFSPDGTRMVFVSDRSGREHLWVQDLDGAKPVGKPWRLTDGEETELFPSWSPTGNQVAFVRGVDVWVAEVREGARPSRITSDAGAHVVRWDPERPGLLVSGTWGTPALSIRRVALTDGSTEPFDCGEHLGDASDPGYFGTSRDGRFLVVDRPAYTGDVWILEKGARGP